MIIKSIEKNSIADQLDLQIGDVVESINGHKINDIIDYRFYISDEFIEIQIKRDDQQFVLDIEKDDDDDLGLSFQPIKYRCCGNKCIFCFIDQNPAHLRQNLYFKDEDFRLSFLHGNYVTMTNIGTRDLQRIVRQRLSPIYISVHAVDPVVRRAMLGLKKDDRLLEKIELLVAQQIEIHAQIVLCPGVNDGVYLEQTIDKLASFYPYVKSIAIVPVGLTKHRQDLPLLQPVTPIIANEIIQQIELLAERFQKQHDSYLIYLADEFYLSATYELPPAARYDDYYQYENGVGMLRYFMDEFSRQLKKFPHRLLRPCKMRIVTAELAGQFIKNVVVPTLNSIEGLQVDAIVIRNDFYGDSVKVTGLLTGVDIYEQIKHLPPVDWIILPDNCFNEDGLMLDDWTIEMLEQKLQQKIKVSGLNVLALFDEI